MAASLDSALRARPSAAASRMRHLAALVLAVVATTGAVSAQPIIAQLTGLPNPGQVIDFGCCRLAFD